MQFSAQSPKVDRKKFLQKNCLGLEIFKNLDLIMSIVFGNLISKLEYSNISPCHSCVGQQRMRIEDN